ncbi:phage tail tube protein [uncultured Endozoicomonas sp.]|uniref:phage tail tube protein n=1 Tax=uncultured Endozoicomonas sp. TaxID=432652 RepID=UPI00261EC034|nr:phage tail tube protein [uncultured Endozoicomonas sp.]
MSKITGKAVIRVDGQELRSLDGATLNVGGVTREAKQGSSKIWGYTEKPTAPEMSCKVAHTADTDLIALGNITNATIDFETDTGDRYIIVDGWVVDPPSLDSSSGDVDLKFSGVECKRA